MKAGIKAIYELFNQDLEHSDLYRKVRRLSFHVAQEIGKELVDEALSDLYLFYDDCGHIHLQNLLRSAYERHHRYDLHSELEDRFNKDGILVLSNDLQSFKVLHLNVKQSRFDFPFQCSTWLLGKGAISDAIYPDVKTAIFDQSLHRYTITDTASLEDIENELCESESSFQQAHHEAVGTFKME